MRVMKVGNGQGKHSKYQNKPGHNLNMQIIINKMDFVNFSSIEHAEKK